MMRLILKWLPQFTTLAREINKHWDFEKAKWAKWNVTKLDGDGEFKRLIMVACDKIWSHKIEFKIRERIFNTEKEKKNTANKLWKKFPHHHPKWVQCRLERVQFDVGISPVFESRFMFHYCWLVCMPKLFIVVCCWTLLFFSSYTRAATRKSEYYENPSVATSSLDSHLFKRSVAILKFFVKVKGVCEVCVKFS